MRRHMIIIGLIGLATLAGCGGSEDAEPAAAGGTETVSMQEIEGVGEVLVDAGGSALYTAEQEADGRIRCVDGCLALWEPLTAPPDGPPVAGDGVDGALAVVERDDGARQVTYDGSPVYRFVEDGPGQVTGDGLEDSFDGTTFTWNVIATGDGGGDAPSGGGYSY